ncbi:hypothetical protein ScPMuIL_013201 [Solemya velum]
MEMEETIQENTEGETITVSLEDAAQIILQEQGIDGTVHFTPGTYHILTQDGIQVANNMDDTSSTDQIQLDVVHATPEELEGLTTHTILQTEDGTHIIAGASDSYLNEKCGLVVKNEGTDDTSFQLTQTTDTAPSTTNQSVSQYITTSDGKTVMVIHPVQLDTDYPEGMDSSEVIDQSEDQVEGTLNFETTNQSSETDVQSQEKPMDGTGMECVDPIVDALLQNSAENADLENQEIQQQLPEGENNNQQEPQEPKSRKPDLSKPIAVTDRTEVMISGKKCILMPNPDTGQLCAYPLLPPPGKRRRGRPRKKIVSPEETEAVEDQEPVAGVDDNSNDVLPAPESNIDNTNSAAEGLLELSYTGPDGVRRSGRVRKKAKTLDDYEILEVSSDEEQPDDDDDEVTPPGFKRRKVPVQKDYSAFSSLFPTGVKRGRGRPRRYPPPGQSSLPTQIPAVLIPGANGQTLMMAPIQGMSNLQALQEQMKSMTQINIAPALGVNDATAVTTAADDATTTLTIDANSAGTDISQELNQAAEAAEEAAAAAGKSFAQMLEKEIPDGKSDEDDGAEDAKPTIIQIPENLLPMFLQKKQDPVKIGLKASETELEKLKCQKCDFQAFYPHQYQSHIAAHDAEVQKCKCCSFLTFDHEDLMKHFVQSHPRCICSICDFTAEHAYIIKRHMMRHNTNGCTCDICGKVYKDQYILRMHVKMVHMPAEVLFECTVCTKKFTRKAHLKRHLRIHDPEKPFKCPHCDYRGCEKSDISKHLLIHEEPKHLCEVCGKAFRHIKNKELHVKRHNGQKDYKCGVCDFYGYTFTDIRKHIERKHSDIKTLVCDKCGLAFKSEMMLKDHRKQQCEVFMIEQALAIATSTGGTSQATIQIPSFAVDGQHITIDGQQIAVDSSGHVNITVEEVSLPGE